MTLKHAQGHWKWYQQVKLNQWHFDIHHIDFNFYIPDAQLASWPNMDHYMESYFVHANQKVQDQTHSKNQLSNHQYVRVGVMIHMQ